MDVTDRSLPARSRSTISRTITSDTGQISNQQSDLKSLLKEIEPLKGSSMLSPKEVDEIMQSTAKIVGDTSVDWNKRLNMLRTFRSLCYDSTHHSLIVAYLRHLMPPFQNVVKDLRSQISREACLTVAYIGQQLGTKSEFFMEPLMTAMFSLLVANAKIVSVSGVATIEIIYETVPSWRLIPPLQSHMLSKSKEVRRAVCSAMRIILHCWPSGTIQKQAHLVHAIIKKGLTDADPEARTISRDCFPAFQKTFPGLATSILESLDPNQRKQLLAILSNHQYVHSSSSSSSNTTPAHHHVNNHSSTLNSTTSNMKTNGNGGLHTSNLPTASGTSISRTNSLKRTNIPVLATRVVTPVKTPAGRSTSSIDVQAAHRAKNLHFSTLTRPPLKYMGRTNSMASQSNNSLTPLNNFSTPSNNYNNHSGPNSLYSSNNSNNQMLSQERSRNRSRISRLSHSQPGSRSNSPSSKYAYATYNTPYGGHEGSPSSMLSPQSGIRGVRRMSATTTSSASSSRDTSPTRHNKLRSRSVTQQSPHILQLNPSSPTTKMLLASRDAELLHHQDVGNRYDHDIDYGGNHSDSEDSLSSHRSFLSETFSPSSNHSRQFGYEEKVEDLLHKCGSAKWSERKEGLLGLQAYLLRHGSIPSQHFNRIGQTFCRIFMDAHTKVLSLFLDVLHAVLYRHAKDLVDFTTILLNRVLTKVGSDLLTSVHTKLLKTLEIIMEEMPPDLQFSAVTHYLCDPTQTPNTRSRVAALVHLYNLSTFSIGVKLDELQMLVEKILDWCGDMRYNELRRMSQKVFYALFDMSAPQMTLVLSQMSPHKQDQAKSILRNSQQQQQQQESPVGRSPNNSLPQQQQQTQNNNSDDRVDSGVGWNSISNDIQALRIQCTDSELVTILTQMATTSGNKKSELISQLFNILKGADDAKLLEHHKEILKVVFDTLTEVQKSSDKAMCFACLEEMCKRPALSSNLSAFAELFIVRVTDVQTEIREVTKAAEMCGMAMALNFPPDSLVRALCPIVQTRDYPVNQMAIKMLQKLSESCEISKLRQLVPDMITTLIGAYDHPDSAVRKAAVFAIVSLHLRIGSPDLQSYLENLSGSKLKLLQLYIQRAQQQQQNQSLTGA